MPGPRRSLAATAAWAAALVVAACSGGSSDPAQRPTVTAPAPEALVVEVLGERPHDPASYTQGWELHEGRLFESAGQYGRSSLREVDPATGAVLRRRDLPREMFAEGLTVVGDRIIQLTWREHVALVWDAATFDEVGRFTYDTEGWGLCLDGQRLVMSDGSATLWFRDPATFDVVGQVEVIADGQPVTKLNELECHDGRVYANVYQTDRIVEIDPATGAVVATVDASGLLTADERARADVLNGITWDEARGTFLITGKNWPRAFEVAFVPA